MAPARPPKSFFTPQVAYEALIGSFAKLDPRHLWRNPVMLSVEIGSLITTASFFYALAAGGNWPFFGLVAVWLWLTVLFANFAESVAEIKGKAKADELRRTRSNLMAKLVKEKRFGAPFEVVPAADLQ